jgi:hypothetical protein
MDGLMGRLMEGEKNGRTLNMHRGADDTASECTKD